MKNLGKIVDPKDITTKEYVDSSKKELDQTKVDRSELSELSAEEVELLWNQYFNK